MRRLACLLVILVLAGWSASFAAQQFRVTIANRATVKSMGVGVYEEASCVTRVTSIDWGTLDPGGSKAKTAYIRNESNVPVTLGLSTVNWQPPEAAIYMTLSWDYAGLDLNPGDVASVILTLTISPDVAGVTTFSFDIVITGTG